MQKELFILVTVLNFLDKSGKEQEQKTQRLESAIAQLQKYRLLWRTFTLCYRK
jgi:hypothetical protein